MHCDMILVLFSTISLYTYQNEYITHDDDDGDSVSSVSWRAGLMITAHGLSLNWDQ